MPVPLLAYIQRLQTPINLPFPITCSAQQWIWPWGADCCPPPSCSNLDNRDTIGPGNHAYNAFRGYIGFGHLVLVPKALSYSLLHMSNSSSRNFYNYNTNGSRITEPEKKSIYTQMHVVFANAKSINIIMFSDKSYQSICKGHEHIN